MSETPTRSRTASPRRLYPSHLELFQQCRHRFRLKVVERRPVADQPGPALAKGNAAHAVLKICGREWMETASMPANLRPLVASRLLRADYASDADWERDVAEVMAWVKYGLTHLDLHATILGAEKFLERSYQPEDGSTPIPLGAVVDLILLRTDHNGARFIEVVDYKTGKNLDASLFAPVLTRFVLRPLIKRHFPGEDFFPVIFTELYLARQHVRTSELTQARCEEDWTEVKRTLAAISAESVWPATPSPLCEWCPFNLNGCTPTIDDDTGTLW